MTGGVTWAAEQGLRVLRFPALAPAGGATALFTTRHGGVSPAPWHSLNFSYSVGDGPGHVAENRRRALAVAAVPLERSLVAGLVHGDRVRVVGAPCPGTGPGTPVGDRSGLVPDCDGLATATPGLALAVTCADCVPVYLYDPVRQAGALVHAGWRGTALGVAARAVATLAAAFGSAPGNLRGAIGPSIGPCCYEVDEPVRRAFIAPAAAAWFTPAAAGRFRLNLWQANYDQLRAAGVPGDGVTVAGLCTACRTGDFFSHRGEGGRTGRMAAILALTPRGVGR